MSSVLPKGNTPVKTVVAREFQRSHAGLITEE